ncbi:V-type ATPase 116kDa subunit family protein [Caprobacter fermentans]|uniref:V-type ATPase 116kDa subunit family protein n=1 Tax=Caproicibacter fermentans TaxID=2576756 RepID=A0A6N8I2H4_9FIRM|nr:V-type ATPase 116kDa subunit family protein [Caproicibacter fermentans]MVB11870.1 V-type ATPase 116kDa subunit family protein [Caproicibacter fermentans]OCM99890.1 ATPase [Clostridium sp. W14A]
MAVVKIKILNVIGRMSELDEVTTMLGKSGIFHPDNALAFYSDTSEFIPLNDENPYTDALHTLEDTLKTIDRHVDLLSVRMVDKIAPSVKNWRSYVKSFSSSVDDLIKKRNEIDRQISEDIREIEKVRHFSGLDLNLDDLRDCKFIRIRFGSLPVESYEKLSSYENNPYVVFFPGSRDEERYWGMYCAPIDRIAEVDRIFSGLYFERTRLHELTGTMKTALSQLTAKRDDEANQKAEINRQIDALWNKEKQMVQNVYSWLSEEYVYYNIRRYAARYGDNFILTGWIPADRENQIQAQMNELETVKCTFDRAEEPEVLMHSPPVELNNKKLFRPFEYFVEIYGLPSYDEIDPTILVAITYFFLFGIMFADLGQGICVAAAGYIMWKKMKMKLGRILIPCGISSSFFGVLFGSFFGFEHFLDPLYHSLFGLSEKPISVMEPETTNMIILFSVALGISLVLIAILINIYSSLRRKNYTNALFGPNGVAGLIFYASIVFGFGGQILLGIKIVTLPYVLCLIVLPLISMFFREILGGLAEARPNWKPEKWSDFLMQNFFEVFEFLLSFLTNTMSFIRVGAFVLVHAGMMMVVFMLAEMFSGIGFAVVVLVGNIFVIALEGLLVGIQALRLEFYEMFSRFFDGEGRPFLPVVVRQET